MEVSLSLFDLLSLYTEIDEHEGTVKTTRSVLVHQPSHTETVIIDGLTFDLFISIPRDLKPETLRHFMINSYCFRHYNSPYTKTSYNAKPKGIAPEEEANPMISDEIKEILSLVDDRNDSLFAEFLAKNKKKRKKDDHKEEEEEELSISDNEDGSLVEINDLFSGLEKDFCTPLMMMHVVKSQPRECKALPGQDQYRLIFRNHHTLTHFINRFKREITIQGENAATFNVNVLAYTLPNGNNGRARPTDTLFKGRAHEYIDGQLHLFKDKRDRLALRFPSHRHISYGLLHPSCCDGDNNTARQQTPNLLENMVNSKKVQYKSTTTGYQTLYIDLYMCRANEISIRIVDHKSRQLYEKNTLSTSKKRTLSEKPIKNQHQLGTFFQVTKKARLTEIEK